MADISPTAKLEADILHGRMTELADIIGRVVHMNFLDIAVKSPGALGDANFQIARARDALLALEGAYLAAVEREVRAAWAREQALIAGPRDDMMAEGV